MHCKRGAGALSLIALGKSTWRMLLVTPLDLQHTRQVLGPTQAYLTHACQLQNCKIRNCQSCTAATNKIPLCEQWWKQSGLCVSIVNHNPLPCIVTHGVVRCSRMPCAPSMELPWVTKHMLTPSPPHSDHGSAPHDRTVPCDGHRSNVFDPKTWTPKGG